MSPQNPHDQMAALIAIQRPYSWFGLPPAWASAMRSDRVSRAQQQAAAATKQAKRDAELARVMADAIKANWATIADGEVVQSGPLTKVVLDALKAAGCRL